MDLGQLKLKEKLNIQLSNRLFQSLIGLFFEKLINRTRIESPMLHVNTDNNETYSKGKIR